MKPWLSPTLTRFVIAGGMNTLFGLVVYSALALTVLPTWIVLVITNVSGMAFNYATTGGFVFRDLSPRRVPRFLLCYALILTLYWVLIKVLSPIAGGRIGALAIIIVPMTGLTFLLQSRLVFGDAQKGSAAPEPDRGEA